MGCDIVAALPAATGSEQMFFCVNAHRRSSDLHFMKRTAGRQFAPGEVQRTKFLEIPQARQTCAVLAVQPAGSWGYLFGINEHRVAVAFSNWQSVTQLDRPGLLGSELVRLTLERSHNSRQALEILTDLIARHGQGQFSQSADDERFDHVFLLADPSEAYAVEVAGSAWAAQEICQLRAVSDVAVIRQDWYRLAPGAAEHAIEAGLWPPDGSKLDFVGALSACPTGQSSALRRWGRATLLLEQQNGHIDAVVLRRLLGDHYNGAPYEVDPFDAKPLVTPLCQHGREGPGLVTAVAGIAQVPTDAAGFSVLWTAFGSPCVSVFFPLLLEGELPAALVEQTSGIALQSSQLSRHCESDARAWSMAREEFARLQARFDQDLEEFLIEAQILRSRGEQSHLQRLATSLMASHVECFEESAKRLLGEQRQPFAMAAAGEGQSEHF